MPPEQFRLGQPPLGPPCVDLLDPEADLTPPWFSKIEGWAPDELRGVKLGQLDDGVPGLRFLDACRAILTPELSWVDVRDVCSRLLVASSMLSHPNRANVSASEGCKAMAPQVPFGMPPRRRRRRLPFTLPSEGSSEDMPENSIA